MSVPHVMPPYPDAQEQICPPAGSKEQDPPFSQGLGLHASVGSKSGRADWGYSGCKLVPSIPYQVHTFRCSRIRYLRVVRCNGAFADDLPVTLFLVVRCKRYAEASIFEREQASYLTIWNILTSRPPSSGVGTEVRAGRASSD